MTGVLNGRVAVVTGAGRGIGQATALLLAEHGARVVASDLDAGALEETLALLDGRGTAVAADLTDPDTPPEIVDRAVREYGQLDIVVNNAGYTWDGIFHKMGDDQLAAMLDIHLVAPFRLLRAAAPVLREAAKRDAAQGREIFRKVVNVVSISGTMGNVGQANYSAAKSGLVGLTKTLAKEWGPLKINVNAVAFGFVQTRLTAETAEAGTFDRGDRQIPLGIPAQVREQAAARIPVGRGATPADAAGGIFLLCTPWSNFIHGQVITVAGGQAEGMSY
ncbi:SDR family oxidoreductase [Micromonospora sp. WMMD1102]|uniref:SDR family NAD(P)-dependent oxidoreductase n=1 Tax=Micromonospora sp. WMMD1102 TaxID=3016105 RepID=UPI002414F851|nr:SDR family oxidoreductase [Micromonospora sp. WMMD1102]MDG4785340.1 SDR family oxidoreductase [Micromonospora sp. WMMD1102]